MTPEKEPNQATEPWLGRGKGAAALLISLTVLTTFVWSYWPQLKEMVSAWEHEPDYSHGYLVIPLAIYFLWHRRDRMPKVPYRPAALGLVLIVVATSLRVVGALWYVEAVQAWSMLIWICGLFWLLGGWRMARWALPAIAFLAFMIPLPFRAEHSLSYPLQSVATRVSCWMLQFIGQPAIREGNVVRIADVELVVAEACSGLRIFVSILALAYALSVLAARPWWTKVAIWLSVLPVAVMVNALRIAFTGLLHVYASDESARRFSHDLAGWLMIPLAGGLMYLVIRYMDRLFTAARALETHELFQHSASSVARGS